MDAGQFGYIILRLECYIFNMCGLDGECCIFSILWFPALKCALSESEQKTALSHKMSTSIEMWRHITSHHTVVIIKTNTHFALCSLLFCAVLCCAVTCWWSYNTSIYLRTLQLLEWTWNRISYRNGNSKSMLVKFQTTNAQNNAVHRSMCAHVCFMLDETTLLLHWINESSGWCVLYL